MLFRPELFDCYSLAPTTVHSGRFCIAKSNHPPLFCSSLALAVAPGVNLDHSKQPAWFQTLLREHTRVANLPWLSLPLIIGTGTLDKSESFSISLSIMLPVNLQTSRGHSRERNWGFSGFHDARLDAKSLEMVHFRNRWARKTIQSRSLLLLPLLRPSALAVGPPSRSILRRQLIFDSPQDVSPANVNAAVHRSCQTTPMDALSSYRAPPGRKPTKAPSTHAKVRRCRLRESPTVLKNSHSHNCRDATRRPERRSRHQKRADAIDSTNAP